MTAARVTLEDGCVRLSPCELSDIPTLMAIDADPEIQRWLDWPLGSSGTDLSALAARRIGAERTVRVAQIRWQLGDLFAFIVRASDGRGGLGWIDLQPRAGGFGNVAYGVLPAFRRRGVATRAVRLACQYAFDVLGWPGLEIRAAADNRASRAVASRAGFALDRVLLCQGRYEKHQPLLGQRFDQAIYRRQRA